MKRPVVIGFDLFNTVISLDGVPEEQVRGYGETIRAPEWRPFEWPKSWEFLKAFPDARKGLQTLNDNGFLTVAMSNAPLALSMRMIYVNLLPFNGIIPLEVIKTYKPKHATYTFAQQLCGVEREEFMMVSANKTFGDIEAARELGMQAQLIRQPDADHPADMIELAVMLANTAWD